MELINKRINEILNNELGCSSYEMATIGSFMQKVGDSKNQTGFKVYVTNDNRPLSHIHIIQQDKIRKKVCVEFSNPPRYFIHDIYRDTFTPSEAKEFNKFLSLPYKYAQTFKIGREKYKVKTYWQYCIYQWKLENDGMADNLHLETDDKGFIIFPKQPDYTKLTACKIAKTTKISKGSK